MLRTVAGWIFLLVLHTAAAATYGAKRRVVDLSLEEKIRLRVGYYAVLVIPSDHIYDQARRGEPHSAGDAIVPAHLRGHRGIGCSVPFTLDEPRL